ncbi:MAG: hypothetical protein E3J35_09965 [Methanomassiliicoccales archaeon]|nr:MAG: hypothetical protein E3J35_09965 [Methanomassiliicoccales archaeon]
MAIAVRDLLEHMSFRGLRGVVEYRELPTKSRRKDKCVDELSSLEWNGNQLRFLAKLYNEDKRQSARTIAVYLYRSDALARLDGDTIEKRMKSDSVDFEMRKPGFEVLERSDGLPQTKYWYWQETLVVDDLGEVYKFSLPTHMGFVIDYMNRNVRIHVINPGLAYKCAKALSETLDVDITPMTPVPGV